MCEHGQVWSIHEGIEITSENRSALSIADEQIEEGGSATVFHHATVVIFESWNTYRPSTLHHRRRYWIWILRGLDKYWSSGSAELRVRCSVPIFNMAVDLQHRFVVPRRIAGLRCEEIPIVLMSACPGHDVNARSSAKHSSHGERHGASVDMGIGLRDEFPIPFGSKVFVPSTCLADAWHIVVTTSLKQQHADLWILR